MYQHCPFIVVIFGFLIVTFGLITSFHFIPNFKHSYFDQLLDLRNDSPIIRIWQNGQVVKNFKLYLFNVENPADIMSGAKPILKEIGPYVYQRLDERRVEEVDDVRDTLTYRERSLFVFDKEASKNLQDTDTVTILNPILMSILSNFDQQHDNISRLNDAIFAIYPEIVDFFITTQIRDLMFGGISVEFPENYTEFCNLLQRNVYRFMEFQQNCSSLTFSFYKRLNNTIQRPFTITRGIKNTLRGYYVPYVNNLTIWKNDYCDQINGTNLGVFDNMEIKPDRIYTYRDDFCRSIFLEFMGEYPYNGLKSMLKFASTAQLFAVNENTTCFCPTKSHHNRLIKDCPANGLMNLKTCIGVDFFLSHPYFGYTDSVAMNFGNFNANLHNSIVYVEPLGGIPLYYNLRYQYSLLLPKVENWYLTSNVTMAVFPLFWVEDEFELSKNLSNAVKQKYKIVKIWSIIGYSLIGFGILSMLLSTILLGYNERICSSNNNNYVRGKDKKKVKIIVRINGKPIH